MLAPIFTVGKECAMIKKRTQCDWRQVEKTTMEHWEIGRSPGQEQERSLSVRRVLFFLFLGRDGVY